MEQQSTIEATVETDFITVTEAARIANVHNNTMRDWIKTGKIPAFQAKEGGWYRISKSTLLSILSGQALS